MTTVDTTSREIRKNITKILLESDILIYLNKQNELPNQFMLSLLIKSSYELYIIYIYMYFILTHESSKHTDIIVSHTPSWNIQCPKLKVKWDISGMITSVIWHVHLKKSCELFSVIQLNCQVSIIITFLVCSITYDHVCIFKELTSTSLVLYRI